MGLTNTGENRQRYSAKIEPDPSRFQDPETSTYPAWTARAAAWAATKPAVTVYTAPDCVQCKLTRQALDQAGITYATVDLSENPATIEKLKALGHTRAPVVTTQTEHWSGFRPDKIADLKN